MTGASNQGADAPLAARIADDVLALGIADVPDTVRHETSRAFVNWLGCAIGGARTSATRRALHALQPFSGPPQARVYGHDTRVDVMLAALLNCTSVGALAFDDCHTEMILHPTGPVVAAALAYAEHAPVTGENFELSLLLGIEVECRLARALVLPPANGPLGWYLTGITGGVGAAVAVGKLLGLSREGLVSAMSIAAAAAGGFRALHGADTMPFVPGQAARAGLQAALLAAGGFTGPARFLEPPNGMLGLFAAEANADALVRVPGAGFEIERNAYKPFPCGIVIHALIDACLQLHRDDGVQASRIAGVTAWVPPATIALTGGNRHPPDELAAMVSLHHWAAVALLEGVAGVAQGSRARIDDPAVRDLRDRIAAHADDRLPPSGANVELRLVDGQVLRREIRDIRPVSDADLDRKFLSQASEALGPDTARRLLAAAWQVGRADNVGACLGG